MRDYGDWARDSWQEGRKKNLWFEEVRERSEKTTIKDVILDKRRLMPALTDTLSYLKEYCTYSSVHGFRYLSEERRNWFEKLFWITAIAVCVAGCSLMILEIKTKLDTTPVIVSFAESPTNIWHIPFPAVTVCPMTRSRQSAFNFTKYLKFVLKNDDFLEDFKVWLKRSITDEGPNADQDVEAFPPISPKTVLIDNDTIFTFGNSELRNSVYQKLYTLHTTCPVSLDWPTNGSRTLHEHELELLLELAPKINTGENFPNHYLMSSTRVPLDLDFKHSWTELGLCFTFNMMDNIYIYNDKIVNNDVFKKRGLDTHFPKELNDWDPDKGFTDIFKPETYPRRAFFGKESGFCMIMMENRRDTDQCWGKGSTGYRMILHQPHDHPQVATNGDIKMAFSKYTDLVVKPEVMTTSPELVKYDPHKRQCYYSFEKRLEYFKFYTESNCKLECWTNATLKMCGCVAFYMPIGIKKHGIRATLEELYDQGVSPFNYANTKSGCDCLPSCFSITYNADITTTDWGEEIPDYDFDRPPNATTVTATTVKLVFTNDYFTARQRREMFGRIGFLASCGGFLGLFCGVSILSFVEMIYFLTLRLWTNAHRRWKSKIGQQRTNE